MVSSDSAAPELPPPTKFRGRWLRLAIVLGPILLLGAVVGLSRMEPSFYRSRIEWPDGAQRHVLSNEFLAKGSRLVGDIQNSPAWEVHFSEDQINGWLAEDFELNHAPKSLPRGVSHPRVALRGSDARIAFRWKYGPVATVIQIGGRVWVPRRNLLAVEIANVHAGYLPLPTTYIRRVFEEFAAAQDLEISWRRNGPHLVGLIDFERTNRPLVLRRAEIADGSLHIEGLSGSGIPATDYAPSAN